MFEGALLFERETNRQVADERVGGALHVAATIAAASGVGKIGRSDTYQTFRTATPPDHASNLILPQWRAAQRRPGRSMMDPLWEARHDGPTVRPHVAASARVGRRATG